MPLSRAWPLTEKPNAWWRFRSRCALFIVSRMGYFFIHKLNKFKIHNHERLFDCLKRKDSLGRSLITPANHKSYFDDPILISALTRFKWSEDDRYRWAMGADEILFTLPVMSSFFSMGKVVPVVRGDGIHQRCVNFFLQLMRDDSVWIKIFPEGRITFNDTDWVKFRWGIGRLISETEKTPLVLPYWHCGMEKILSVDQFASNVVPKVGQKITLVIGSEIELSDVVKEMRDDKKDLRYQRIVITKIIEDEMKLLRQEALDLHFSRYE